MGYGLNFWWQKHAFTGKSIISYVHPATGLKVITDAEFFEQDHTDKATEYQPDKPFFEQIRALQLAVPYPAQRNIVPPTNSLSIASFGDENSFFTIGCKSKKTLYSIVSQEIENSAEVLHSDHVVNSYRVSNSHRIFNGKFIMQSFDCLNSAFLFDCRNCENCFGVANKRNKKFLWWDEPLSEGEWKDRMSKIRLGERSILQEQVNRYRAWVGERAVWPENFNEHAENCVGEFLYKCRDCKNVYVGNNGPHKNWYGVYYSGACERNAFMGGASDCSDNYCCHAPYRSHGCKFSHNVINCQNMEYCIQCYDCEDCFGCVGLVRKRFCIFNKPYDEAAYWAKVDALKTHLLSNGEYGEFFPLSFSPSYVPLATNMVYLTTTEDRRAMGALEFDPDAGNAFGNLSVLAASIEDIPENIDDIDPAVWSKKIFMDEKEGRRFAMLEPELRLCKELGIAPTLSHPVARMREMMLSANTAVFEEAKCRKCHTHINTAKNVTYPNRTIYCRACYLQFIEANG